MHRKILLIIVFTFIAQICFASEGETFPPGGVVPDSETAIRIAVAIWKPIYGEKNIAKQAPYKATLIRGIWHVTGSMPKDREVIKPDGTKRIIATAGGVAFIKISKKNCEVLWIGHGE